MRTSSKFFTAVLALTLLLPSLARSDENPYDVVGKVLLPFARIFIPAARTQNHALTAVLTLDEATGLPADSAGQTLDVAVQSPDKLRLHTTLLGQEITVCRNGDDVWAFPGSKIDALISTQTDTLPPENPNFKLPAFRLPLTEKQLVFLPILFQVQDAGSTDVAGETCRVLDLVLMPELARALKAQDWTARLWVGPGYHLARITLVRGDKWHAVVSIKKLEYAPSLPDETWQPSAAEAPDVLKLTPGRYGQLLEAATRGLTKLKSPQ